MHRLCDAGTWEAIDPRLRPLPTSSVILIPGTLAQEPQPASTPLTLSGIPFDDQYSATVGLAPCITAIRGNLTALV